MRRLALILAAFLVAGAPAMAKNGKGRGEGSGHGRGNGAKERRAEARAFRSEDRVVIVDYYRGLPGGLPPGLAKRGGDLPPGLEKQLRRNGTLPPGLQKKVVPFPAELEMRLPPCPIGVQRGLVGGVAVMWNTHSGLILDASAMFGL